MQTTAPQEVGTDSSIKPLSDYYRCHNGFAHFEIREPQGAADGYFLFGRDTLCYGRLSCGDHAARLPGRDLHDALNCTRVEPHSITLPFAVEEVIENLRRERYAAHFRVEGRLLNDLVRKAYYCVRPFLTDSIRHFLQRIYLRGWDKIAFPAWPVDTTVDRLHKRLLALALKVQGLEKIPFIWFWPDGYSSCAIVTHDVEQAEGRDFCPKLMDLDEAFGMKAAFQVVPEDRYTVTRTFLESLTSRGFEVNVHDLKHDGRLYAERAEFLRRAERINSYVREYGAQGFRSGILYRNAEWFDAFEFSYDMSLPNVAHLDPQRGGCCTVMPFFIGRIVELPVTCTQDFTLFRILQDYSMNLWKTQIARIREEHGLISLIVHPDYVIEQRARDVYKSLLEHLAELREKEHVWTPRADDVANWWRQRSEMELVYENGQWRVEGAGKERARVAYASLSGDMVTYALDE